jgi:hypothetical protein
MFQRADNAADGCAAYSRGRLLDQPLPQAVATTMVALLPAQMLACCRIWLERVRTLYELNQQGLQVILTDLDAIWTKTPVPYIMGAARGQAQGFDLIVSKGYFPSEVFKNFKVAGEAASCRWCKR